MSKGRLKAVMQEKGVNVFPIYKVIDGKNGPEKVNPNHPQEGVMHYRAERKRKVF